MGKIRHIGLYTPLSSLNLNTSCIDALFVRAFANGDLYIFEAYLLLQMYFHHYFCPGLQTQPTG